MPRKKLALPMHAGVVRQFSKLRLHFLGCPVMQTSIRSMRSCRLSQFPRGLSQELKRFIPGFTQKKWTEEMRLIGNLRTHRAKLRHTCLVSAEVVKIRNDFAYAFWKKKGSPGFRKRIITGVEWGRGCVDDNGKFGWDKVVIDRVLGVSKRTDPETGRVSLEIVCPD